MLLNLENRSCPTCHISDNKLLYTLTGNNAPFNGVKFGLSYCSKCDLIYLSSLPQEQELFKIYTEHNQFNGGVYTGEHAQAALDFYESRLNEIIQATKMDRENLRTLEIGGGLCWVSKVAKKMNKKNFTVAQDISQECKNLCSTWVDRYLVGNLEEIQDQLKEFGQYDIISMTHVFEHLIQPQKILELCKKLLKRNGIIFITAPHRPKGWKISDPLSVWETWAYNFVPAHLNYYNHGSMNAAAEKCGLKVIFFDANAEEGQAFEAWLCQK